MFMKGLVAAACVVVIAAGGLWIWQQVSPAVPTREQCLQALAPLVAAKDYELTPFLNDCVSKGLINIQDVGGLATGSQ